MQKNPYAQTPQMRETDFSVEAPLIDKLPSGGGLGGTKRLQLQQQGGRQLDSTGRTQRNGGIVPPSSPKAPSTPTAGYEKPTKFNQAASQLSALSNPNFPRRRGQGT